MICREGLQITSIMPLHNICYARPFGHGGSHFTLKDGRNDCTCSHNHITHQPLPQTTSQWRQSPCNKQYERRYCSCSLYCVACLLYSRLLGNGSSPCITKRRRKGLQSFPSSCSTIALARHMVAVHQTAWQWGQPLYNKRTEEVIAIVPLTMLHNSPSKTHDIRTPDCGAMGAAPIQ